MVLATEVLIMGPPSRRPGGLARESLACGVCAVAGAKYSCPKCREAYCCVACCKEHKARCSGVPPPKRRTRPAPRAERTRDDFDNDVHALSSDLKARLEGLAYIQTELDKDPDLLDAFQSVDTSLNRAAALAHARTTDVKVAAFIDRVLIDLGVCERDPDSQEITFLGLPRDRNLGLLHAPNLGY